MRKSQQVFPTNSDTASLASCKAHAQSGEIGVTSPLHADIRPKRRLEQVRHFFRFSGSIGRDDQNNSIIEVS